MSGFAGTGRARGLDHLWTVRPALVGMVHLPPLPGAPRWAGTLEAVLDRARADALALAGAGFDAVLVENFLDAPFHPGAVPPATVAAMTRAVAAVRAAVDLPVGVNVLRNDAEAALSVAAATGAGFIRVNVHVGSMWTDQGQLEGRAHETLRLRRALGLPTAILADVQVKHAVPPPGARLEDVAADTWHRGLADALIVTGAGTGRRTALDDLRGVRAAVPEAPVLVGSGLDPAGARRLLDEAAGGIVGTTLMRDGRPGSGIDPERAKRFVDAVRG